MGDIDLSLIATGRSCPTERKGGFFLYFSKRLGKAEMHIYTEKTCQNLSFRLNICILWSKVWSRCFQTKEKEPEKAHCRAKSQVLYMAGTCGN